MKIVFSVFLVLIYSFPAPMLAQENISNPFEQVWKLNAAQSLHPDSATIFTALRNPFDVVAHRVPIAKAIQANTGTTKVASIRKIVLRQQNTTFVWWALIAILGFLALTINARKGVLKLAWDSFVSNSLMVLNQRDISSPTKKIPLYLLYIHFLLNMGMFVFLFFRSLTGEEYNKFAYFALITLLVTAFFLFKHTLLSVLGAIFPAKKEFAQLDFLLLNFNAILGLFLLPFNFILALMPGAERILPFWVAGIIVIFYIFRQMRSIMVGSKIIFQYLFHFLLYLCTIEFVPLLILLKILLKRVA
jgi:hypothetical protein